MPRAPANLTADLADAMRREERAHAEEKRAHLQVLDAVRDQVSSLEALRASGCPLTNAVVPVLKALGEPTDLASRKRLAARLRKRKQRQRVTAGHAEDRYKTNTGAGTSLPSTVRKEATMADRIKRVIEKTTTTEYVTPEEDLEVDDEVEDVEEEADDEQDDKDTGRNRRSAAKR